jgi:hypothetical protein
MHKQEIHRKREKQSERKADFENLVSNTKRDGKQTIMQGSVVEVTSKANSPFVFPVMLSSCNYLYT